ncbi:SRPBCC family protein [Halomonas sp. M4R5S39]|uniref:SRPBCC family protein n=1 Tax=Halomonas kalidii TaxID=3043293 RepID=UPI0024A9DB4F|nr:SRPBCC family protein [Halomonas kalidii]MDI5986642.1 SRPBCC family protein [Halomonas kalidii]
MAEFRFVTTWRFEAPIDAVYRAISDSPCWPAWWESLCSVEELAPGDASGIGRRYRYTWKSRLGYRLRFEIRVTRVRPGRSIEGIASGDVQGSGRWQLTEEGRVTRVRYEWRVRPVRRWMALVAPVAGPLFAWNHHAVMQDGATGLARWLDVRLLGTSRG